MSFTCITCGQVHHGLPAATLEGPTVWLQASDAERTTDFIKSDDLCAWKEEHFFVRCALEVSITDSDEVLSFGVWCGLSREDLGRYLDDWDHPEREVLPPIVGWLSNMLPGYPDTLDLKVILHPQSAGWRPLVELEATDHPLVNQQRAGITFDEASAYLHEIGMI